MRNKELPVIEGQSWLYSLDDAALMLKLVCALEPPEPEWLPLPAQDTGGGDESRFESPMTKAQAAAAIENLQHAAIHIAVLHIGPVLESLCGALNGTVRSAVDQAIQITRLIRDAYSADPYAPVWQMDSTQENVSLCVPDVIAVDVTELNGQRVNMPDYGGPEAILRLLEFTRRFLDEARL